ncbi:MAG: MarR family transcriptional regulator [Bauldia sp.]|nr:MarR family transcriptional regulator [Bauldia sp.]
MGSTDPPLIAPSLRLSLGWALTALLRTYQKHVEKALEGLPGGSRAFLVMSLVERETCHSQIAIAERLTLDKTTLTYLLDGLEKIKLIKRTTDPVDRRTRQIELTAKGSRTLADLSKAVERVELEVLSRLPRADAQQFYELLVKAAGLVEGAPAPPDSEEICQAALGTDQSGA